MAYHDAHQTPDVVLLPQKNTFVHFDEPSSPTTRWPPPSKSAPDCLSQLLRPSTDVVGLDFTAPRGESASSLASVTSYVSSVADVGQDPATVVLQHHCLDRAACVVEDFEPGAREARLVGNVRLSTVLEVQRHGLRSHGCRGHDQGRCVPCLMEARWNAGKSDAPCKFGLLCGRCHERHSEGGVQRIQAQMRKLRRQRRGAQ